MSSVRILAGSRGRLDTAGYILSLWGNRCALKFDISLEWEEGSSISTLDLITEWELALANALSPADLDELPERELERAAGVAIRSRLQAGDVSTEEFVTCRRECHL